MPRTVRSLSVEYRLLSTIRGATRNPKDHDLPAIRASFDRFGLGDVAGIVDERTGRLVAGHGRVGCLLDIVRRWATHTGRTPLRNGRPRHLR